MKKALILYTAVIVVFIAVSVGVLLWRHQTIGYQISENTAPSDDELYKYDLNTINAEQLEQIPGIGPVTAQNIIAYRNEHGPFSHVEELYNVSGIGPSTMAQIMDYVTVK